MLTNYILYYNVKKGYEEFGANASILFDETAAAHIALDALGAAATLMVKMLVE